MRCVSKDDATELERYGVDAIGAGVGERSAATLVTFA
jgi:hypothetical protein